MNPFEHEIFGIKEVPGFTDIYPIIVSGRETNQKITRVIGNIFDNYFPC